MFYYQSNMNYTIGSNKTHPFVTQGNTRKKAIEIEEEEKGISPEDFVPTIYFSNGSEYDYFFEAYRGLQLEDDFEKANKCIIQDIIGVIDNGYQFVNNYTFEFTYKPEEQRNFMLPVLNITKMVGVNFANIFPDCYELVALEMYKYFLTIYINAGEDFNNLLLSFLFSQMSNAKKFQEAIT